MTERVPQILTLPSGYLEKSGPHYVPFASHDELEIAERRSQPRGDLTLAHQLRGFVFSHLAVSETMLGAFKKPEKVTAAIAVAGLATAWYMLAQNPANTRELQEIEPMNKNIQLPKFAEEAEGAVHTKTLEEAQRDISLGLESVIFGASKNLQKYRDKRRISLESNEKLGKALGTASIALRSLGLFGEDGELSSDNVFDIQTAVKKSGKTLLNDDTREMTHAIESYPSMAQLGHVESPLLVHLRRNVPKADSDALNELSWLVARTDTDRLPALTAEVHKRLAVELG